MRRTCLAVTFAAALAACSDGPVAARSPGATALLARGDGAQAYVVVLRDGADARGVAAAAGAVPRHVYGAALNGFAARLTPAQAQALRHNPHVAWMEADQPVAAAGIDTSPTWAQDRIGQRALPLDGVYQWPLDPVDVHAYVIDSGIEASHPHFAGNAANVFDVFGGTGADCHGHGSHVSGTIGGTDGGVAPGVKLRGVKVLDCSAQGTVSGVIAGVDWVRRNAVRPAVANLSFTTGYSAALNTAVNSLASVGVFVAVAAGDGNQSACNVSPASAAGAFTTAATTSADARFTGSNFGGCVDAYAPGVAIAGTWIRGGTATLTGSSSAAPFVTATAALYKGRWGDASTAAIDSWIKTWATPGVVTGNPAGTPNLLLYVGIDSWI